MCGVTMCTVCTSGFVVRGMGGKVLEVYDIKVMREQCMLLLVVT